MNSRKNGRVLLALLSLLIALRALLPFFVKWYVNETLNKIPGYRGRMEDVRLHLWRGAYEIIRLQMVKADGGASAPFFSVESADLSVQWRALLHGAFVGKIILMEPRLNFIEGPTRETSQLSIDESWRMRVDELFPLDINYLGITDGSIHFQNPSASPPVDIHLDELTAEARDLSNRRGRKALASVAAMGRPMRQGFFRLNGEFDPFAKMPTFHLEALISQLHLDALNAFIAHYEGVVVKTGTANFYVECAAKDALFKGYAKPFLLDLHFSSTRERGLSFSQTIKGVLGNVLAAVFRNSKNKSDAAKIEFSGKFAEPRVSEWAAVRSAFHHAYIHPLAPRLEHSVTIGAARVK